MSDQDEMLYVQILGENLNQKILESKIKNRNKYILFLFFNKISPDYRYLL